jgi:pyruvate,orthophosphate dikinase
MSDNHTFFWNLDSEIPQAQIREYKEAVASGGARCTVLARWLAMLDAKIPVPPMVYVTSAVIELAPNKLPAEFAAELEGAISRLEVLVRARFASGDNPLLLTIGNDYGGTVRNIGVSRECLPALVNHYGRGQAYMMAVDFLETYSNVVLGCPHIDFRRTFAIPEERDGGTQKLAAVSESEFCAHMQAYENLVSQKIRKNFPEGPSRHLLTALMQSAVISKKAGQRGLYHDELFITAQLHQSAFPQSLSGVVFTRNPFANDKGVYGVYRSGEDPKKRPIDTSEDSLRQHHPELFALMKKHLPTIEACYGDVTEAEFVVDENSHLYFTSFDKAETTARVTIGTSIDLCLAGRISDSEAALRISPSEIDVLLHPMLEENSRQSLEDLKASGTAASPGTAIGRVFFSMADVIKFRKTLGNVDASAILFTDELRIADSNGISQICGLVTTASGVASHAAVMARANGVPCMIGVKGVEFGPGGEWVKLGGRQIPKGTVITIEVSEDGKIYLGEGRLLNLSFQDGLVKEVAKLLSRVVRNEKIPLSIYANINGAKDAEMAVNFGATGVGLCRTENMFLGAEALREMRNLIFSQEESRHPAAWKQSLERLEQIQYDDFRKIFEAVPGKTVNIRLMDLPLDDFAPRTEDEIREILAQHPHLEAAHVRSVIGELKEHNPMLGLRGCRYGLIQPDIYQMQMRAIIRAAYAAVEKNLEVDPGIMFPLVFNSEELDRLRADAVMVEEQVRERLKVAFSKRIKIRIGSMIETPSAALSADKMARYGEFFAFGTNDLTQTTLGISRDDSGHYLPKYLKKGVISLNPFKELMPEVKELLNMAVSRGRRVKSDAVFGICGEQSDDLATMRFCMESGIDYISCSPFKVLPAFAALIHAALRDASVG